jgi:hypothetical protein
MKDDLLKHGFTVVKNFLNFTEIESLKNDYNSKKDVISVNDRYHWADLTPEIRNKVHSLVQLINPEYTICMGVYFNNKEINLSWHQDHESFYLWQSTDELVAWIPMHKQHPTLDGISLIDFEELKKHVSPEIYTQMLGRAGSWFKFLDNGNTMWLDDDTNQQIELPINIDSVGVTPEVEVGDILLFRGDVIHRTQHPTAERVAVSVRCHPKNHVMSKQEFYSGSERKRQNLRTVETFFLPLKQTFDHNEFVTIEQMLNYVSDYHSNKPHNF